MAQNSPSYSDNLNVVITEFEKKTATDKARRDALWNSLPEDAQIDLFCAIMERLHKGEIEERGSYRYVLYDVFKFGPQSYSQAQTAGFLDIHNCIYTPNDIRNLLENFVRKRFDLSDKKEIEKHIENFMWDMYA